MRAFDVASLTEIERLAIDRADNLHAVWHGTANTRIYGNDQPFYARRDAADEAGFDALVLLEAPKQGHAERERRDAHAPQIDVRTGMRRSVRAAAGQRDEDGALGEVEHAKLLN